MGKVSDRRGHLVQRPTKVHRRRPGRHQGLARAIERIAGSIGAQRQAHPVGRRRADQRRAAHLHRRDRPHRVLQGPKTHGLEGEGQLGLVDDLDRPAVIAKPDGAKVFARDQHPYCPAISSLIPKDLWY